jgi:hypothetical protein
MYVARMGAEKECLHGFHGKARMKERPLGRPM